MSIAPGMRVTDNVRLVRLLGRGGMGSVWVAHHEALEMDVAVKFVAKELLEGGDPAVVARFRREARLAAKLDSPHVVRVLDTGVTADGVPYIVMELLRGEALSDRIAARGRLDLAEVARVVGEVAEGLEHAHRTGVVHRDVKPHNVFLARTADDAEIAKILDFGIAKTEAQPAQPVTSSGALVGTPQYMSPEQLMRAGPVDKSADVWALAVVAYQALTGELPFRGETLAATLVAITRGDVAPASDAAPGVPPALDAFFARALAVDPGKRYASARELADALAEAARGHVPPSPSVVSTTAKTLVRTDGGADETSSTAEFLSAQALDVPQSARAPSSSDATPRTEPSPPAAHDAEEHAEPSAPRKAKRRGNALLVGGGVVAVVGIGVALEMHRPPAPPAPAGLVDTHATHESAPPTASAVPAVASASAPPKAPPRPLLGNLPSTTIDEGYAPRSRVWLPSFAIAREEGDENATFAEAEHACERKGMSLCTEAEWTRACDAHPELATRSSWTSTAADGGLVVRGGGEPAPGDDAGTTACTSRGVAPADTRAPDRVGVCCSHAVGILSDLTSVAFLKTASAKLRAYELALNSGYGNRVAALTSDPVSYFGKDLEKDKVAEVAGWMGRTSTTLHDTCRVELYTREEKRGWSADCVGIELKHDDATGVFRQYEFGDLGLIELARMPKNPFPLVPAPAASAH